MFGGGFSDVEMHVTLPVGIKEMKDNMLISEIRTRFPLFMLN